MVVAMQVSDEKKWRREVWMRLLTAACLVDALAVVVVVGDDDW